MNWLLKRMKENSDKIAIVINDKEYTYGEIIDNIDEWNSMIQLSNISEGDAIFIKGTISLDVISLIFSLSFNKNIIVPYAGNSNEIAEKYKSISCTNLSIDLDGKGGFRQESNIRQNELYSKLKKYSSPGLVLFSSGTTGDPKGIVLDLRKLIDKYKDTTTEKTIISFLNYDHIGGLNTILYSICSAGCIVIPENKKVKTVLRTIEKWKVEVLPTTPTFINMILMSGYLDEYNMGHLKTITYGTEVMPNYTLESIRKRLPHIHLKQTYGLSEVGIIPTKSKGNNELWIKIGNGNIQYKIIDNILWLKSPTIMLGYLNAESEFDSDGYFNTQDVVEVDGEYIRIKGRKSDIINVAGEKVYPAEVESIIMQVNGVKDVVVSSEKNLIINNSVKATIQYDKNIDKNKLENSIRNLLSEKLESYKRPMIYNFVLTRLHSDRFKRLRKL